jgi:hypothetical protein
MNEQRKYEGQMDPIHRQMRSATILDTLLQHYSSNDALRIIADMVEGMSHVIMDSQYASNDHMLQARETFVKIEQTASAAVGKRGTV